MALQKEIQADGITASYHRILTLALTTNSHNSIVVLSYLDAAARAQEQAGSSEPVYRRGITYETDYDETMTVESAYSYLKTLPDFEGALDV